MRVSRTGWALSGLSLVLVAVIGPEARKLLRDAAGPSFPDASLAVVSLIALALATWSLLAVPMILVAGSTRLVSAITPAVMRRALVVGAAGALAIGPVRAADAGHAEAPQTQRHVLDGLPLPDRPDVVEPVLRAHPPASVVQVRAGDTLWSIAARTLPSTATDTEIAYATQRWHDANRDVIGDDPGLIFPTQHLTPPPTGKDRP